MEKINNNMAVLVIGYNRPACLERLLHFIDSAEYYDDEVDLIISIDYSGSDSVETIAKNFEWKHGNKKVITYPKKQGLKKHILSCGLLLGEYESLIVLEDDIIVSPSYYLFSKQCANEYKKERKVAGISLYTHLWNLEADLPFEPSRDQNDVFFMQYAQSWGQVWMREQWKEFTDWLKSDDGSFDSDFIPSHIKKWPETSWLKYHTKYLIQTNKFFAYPYVSLSSNCSEPGQHNLVASFKWQTPLLFGIKSNYSLPSFSESNVKYDSFFERTHCEMFVNGKSTFVDFDLYGCKTAYKSNYVLSKKKMSYLIVDSFGLLTKPHENNALCNIHGYYFYLYDINMPCKNDRFYKTKKTDIDLFEYYTRINPGIRDSYTFVKNAFYKRLTRKKNDKTF